MLFPALFINVIQLTIKFLYFWDSLYNRAKGQFTLGYGIALFSLRLEFGKVLRLLG